MNCEAIIGYTSGDFRPLPVVCRQSVGVRSYVTTFGTRVGFCSRVGHQASVRRRFAELEPEPNWLHEDPEYADPITAAKAEAAR